MQLIATNDESEHGAKGHVLEIASFKRDTKLHVWCHGVSGLPYSLSEVASLRHQWMDGNFGLSPKNMSNYAIYNNEWDA